jgi:hypothetical protein
MSCAKAVTEEERGKHSSSSSSSSSIGSSSDRLILDPAQPWTVSLPKRGMYTFNCIYKSLFDTGCFCVALARLLGTCST